VVGHIEETGRLKCNKKKKRERERERERVTVGKVGEERGREGERMGKEKKGDEKVISNGKKEINKIK
jgi:hypothetical protein